MTRGRRLVMSAAAVLLIGSLACADTLITKKGRKFPGKVLEENEAKVVFEIHQYGGIYVKTFQRWEIKTIIRGELKVEPVKPVKPGSGRDDRRKVGPEPKSPPIIKYDKPTYYVIPMEGMIGMHITAKYLQRGMDDAMARKADVIILMMDSPGGFIAEVEKLIDVIHTAGKTQRVVIFVRKAISAAAITSLAVKEIYFAPQAIFGAATAYQQDAFGLPDTLAEKFQSVWRAQARSAASLGGHNPLVAEAMIDDKMELYLVKHKDGNMSVKVGKKGGSKQITTKGKLLTLTAGEASEIGLAKDIVSDYDQLGQSMKYKDWAECEGHATLLSKHRKKALKGILRDMDELKADFSRNMRRAWENRPETPALPYRHDTRSGLWVAESRRRWSKRSRECGTFLLRAEGNMKKLCELTEGFDEVKESAEWLRSLEKEVREIRLEVVRKTNKRGPDD